jgi:hypothetical protein
VTSSVVSVVMSANPTPSEDSTCEALGLHLNSFSSRWDSGHNTELYCQEVRDKILKPHAETLKSQYNTYYVNKLLEAMIEHAPHPDGKRYVAVALLSAMDVGLENVIKCAESWAEHLILPSTSLSVYCLHI